MKRYVWIAIALATFVGCEKPGTGALRPFLVRVGDQICTVEDFRRAFEVAKLAYGEQDLSDKTLIDEIRERLLRELTEELVLLERAQEVGLSVSDRELEMAVSDIKADYPEDSFDRMLLENSLSFSYWKEGLRKELLIKRLEAKELEKDIPVSASEIKDFHDRYLADTPREPPTGKAAAEFSRQIVDWVRKEKARKNYRAWVESLWSRYEIEIDPDAWNKIAGT